MINTLQQLNIQQDTLKEQKIFLLKLLNNSLQHAVAPSLKKIFSMAGSKIWKIYGKRLATSSPFLRMVFQAMGDIMFKNKKKVGKDG